MKITNILIVSASMALLTSPLAAQTATVQGGATSTSSAVSSPQKKVTKHPNSVNTRQNRQDKRVEQGVASGELTKKEAAKLNARQEKIERKEERMRSDGELTNKEKAKLQRDLNKSNRAIKKQKHDRQDKE